MKITFAILMLGLVLFSEQQRFPYQFQQRVIPPWMYLDALSDRDLYSYMLARRFGFPNSPSFIPQTNAFLVRILPLLFKSDNQFSSNSRETTNQSQSRVLPLTKLKSLMCTRETMEPFSLWTDRVATPVSF